MQTLASESDRSVATVEADIRTRTEFDLAADVRWQKVRS